MTPGGHEKTSASLTRYSQARHESDELTLISGFSEDWSADDVHWVKVRGLESTEAIRILGEELKLPSLALEDAISPHQLPKFESYQNCYFIVLRVPVMRHDELVLDQVSIFLGDNFVVTVQGFGDDCLSVLDKRLRESRGNIRERKADFLAYSVMDCAVDQYFPILERFDSTLENLEVAVTASSTKDILQDLHTMRRDLLLIRKSAIPTTTAINELSDLCTDAISEGTRHYMRDCHDHLVRVSNIVDSHKEWVNSLMELYISFQGHRMNEIMKVLTLVSTIFIPLGFIVSVYGMKFYQPETQFRYAYPIVMGAMAAIAGGLLYYFWKRGWFGHRKLR